MPFYVPEELQKAYLWLIKNIEEYSRSWYLKSFKTHSCDSSASFDSLLRRFSLRIILPSHLSPNIWTIYVFQPLCITILRMSWFVSRVKLFFWLIIDFARLIRAVRKVAPSVKLISANHSSLMTTIFSRNNSTLPLDVWHDLLFNSVSSNLMFDS